MARTAPSTQSAAAAHESAVGLQRLAHRHRYRPGLIAPLVGQEFLDRLTARPTQPRKLKYGAKQIFRSPAPRRGSSRRSRAWAETPNRLSPSGTRATSI